MKKTKPIRFKRYRTALSIVRAHFDGELPKSVKAVDGNNKPLEWLDGETMVALVESEGVWGFADTRRRVIHFWCNSKVSSTYLAHFFGHEIGHLTGKQARGLAEERRADEYGRAAAQVVKQLRRMGRVGGARANHQ